MAAKALLFYSICTDVESGGRIIHYFGRFVGWLDSSGQLCEGQAVAVAVVLLYVLSRGGLCP